MKILLINLYIFISIVSYSQYAYINTYGGLQSEVGKDLVQTSDGGFFGLGSTSSNSDNNNSQVYLIKLDSTLTFEWSKTFGSGTVESGQSMVKTEDNNYLILANVIENNDYQLKLYKIDIDGEIIWSEIYGGANWDFGNKIIATSDGFLIAGYTYSLGAGQKDAYLIKINVEGEMQWQKAYGGTEDDSFQDIALDNDGNIIAVGKSNSFTSEGYYESYYSKITMVGDTIWTKTHSYNLTNTEANGIAISPVNMMIVGKTYTENKAWQMFNLVVQNDGDVWNYGEIGNAPDDYFSDVVFFEDSYIAAGTTSSYGAGSEDGVLYKFNTYGAYIDGATFGFILNDNLSSIITTPTNEPLIIGYSESAFNNSDDLLIIKLPDSLYFPDDDYKITTHFLDYTISLDEQLMSEKNDLLINYSLNQLQITFVNSVDHFSLHTLKGELIYKTKSKQVDNVINLNSITPGIYFASMIRNNKTYFMKIKAY